MRFTGMRRPMSRTLFLVAMALLALLSISIASAAEGQPTAVTKEADEMHKLYLFVLLMGGIVLVGVEAALVWAVIRYRKKNDDLPVQTHGSTIVEMLWTGIPVAIVIALFTYSFIVLRDVEHSHTPSDLTVGVEGFQFQWAFTYTGNDLGTNTDPNSKASFTITGTAATEPTLVLPVGEPVEFTLKSNDVIHSFFVRNFLYKLDVIPGRDNRFSVTPNKTGDYIGQCAELCGLNHSLMRFHVQIVDRATFDKWFAEKAAGTTAAVQQPQ
jgi:cytochrome c oxidase subunit 2